MELTAKWLLSFAFHVRDERDIFPDGGTPT